MKKNGIYILLAIYTCLFLNIGSITKVFAESVVENYDGLEELKNLEASVVDDVYQQEKALVKNEVYSLVKNEVYSSQLLRIMPSNSTPVIDMSGVTISKTLTVEIGNYSNSGWQYDISLQDFTVTKLYSNSGSLTASFPSSYVAFSVTDLEVSEGDPEEIFLGSGELSDNQTAIKAPEGSGKGTFKASINLNISVPGMLDIQNSHGISVPQGQVGMLTGSYSSTMTCTLVTGI